MVTLISELNDRTRSIFPLVAGIALCALAACSAPSTEAGVDHVKAFRIDATGGWNNEREGFAIRKDGSGFYERYIAFDDQGNTQHKIVQRVEFAAKAGRFEGVFSSVDDLYTYFGDDYSRLDLSEFEGVTKTKKAFRCGTYVTDASSFAIHWNETTLDKANESKTLPDVFVVYRGCQSKEARGKISHVESAIAAIKNFGSAGGS